MQRMGSLTSVTQIIKLEKFQCTVDMIIYDYGKVLVIPIRYALILLITLL